MTRYSYAWLMYLCLMCLCAVPSHANALPVIDLSQHSSGQHTKDNYLFTRHYNETTPLAQVLAENL
ncbi:MAG: hypothetical protein JXR04_06980 [Bermanella sp.]